MTDMGYDVGQGVTIEQDIGATLGGDVDQRKAAGAALHDMAQEEKQIQKSLAKQNKLRDEGVKDLKAQRESLQGQSKELREAAKAEGLSKKERDKLIKQANKLRGQAAHRTQLIKEEEKQIRDNNKALADSKMRLDDILRTKEKQKGVDMALSSADKKKHKRDREAYQKFKREQRDIIDLKKREIQVAKENQRVTSEYINQLDAVQESVGTGLVTAIGLSTAAFAGMKMQLDKVVGVFQDFEEELMNAQSIYQTNQETLFGLSDQIVSFGNQYGVSMQDASQGLYTLASAGLDAEESMEVLGNTLKLSMAVQGDHETIAKLTTQTIFGFGLEMSQSAELTDKFAHSINKSLIEYQDLASAVKFAMPFFVSTGQNIDQLLGSLEVLTNRALEAGIAGRGLRQALAEFAQHANDNEAAFRKLGVEIMDTEGNFKMLTEIAKEFQTAMGPAASDVDLMTTLLEDLNVRGATAFVHLVQNADEFENAVNDLANSSGAATEMADIQQQSLARSIQLIKNSLETPFLMSDEVGKANGFLNEFSMSLHNLTSELQGLIVIMDDGVATGLTPLGESIRDMGIVMVKQFHAVIIDLVQAFQNMTENGTDFTGLINMMTVPLRLVVKLLGAFGATGIEALLILRFMNQLLPVANILTMQLARATEFQVQAMQMDIDKSKQKIQIMQMRAAGDIKAGRASRLLTAIDNESTKMKASQISMIKAQIAATMALNAIQFANIYLMRKYAKDSPETAAMIGVLTGALMGLAVALSLVKQGMVSKNFFTFAAAAVAGAVLMGTMNAMMTKMMKAPEIEEPKFDEIEGTYDMGGRIMYDTGGPRGGGLGSRHKSVMVEPGETIIPKTQNMLSGGAGITLNIQGDIVTNDADDFANRIAEVLPEALRKQNTMGGI
jgi:TP901 family phage tail tape measure protein